MNSDNYTPEELAKWWLAECPMCGWKGLSRDAKGGTPLGDTGDFDDLTCPACFKEGNWISVIEQTNESKPLDVSWLE